MGATHARPIESLAIDLTAEIRSDITQYCALRSGGTVTCWATFSGQLFTTGIASQQIEHLVALP